MTNASSSRTSIIAACPNCGYEVMLDTSFDISSDEPFIVHQAQCPKCGDTVGALTDFTEEFD